MREVFLMICNPARSRQLFVTSSGHKRIFDHAGNNTDKIHNVKSFFHDVTLRRIYDTFSQVRRICQAPSRVR
jgi:hypothetical protein